MNVAHVVPGTGGQFYCQNCLRDDAILESENEPRLTIHRVPMYLPLSAGSAAQADDAPVFYGAINTYLREKASWYREAPRWVEQLLDSGPALRWAARMAGSTKASGLEEMTLSMLEGEDGPHAPELHRLLEYLQAVVRPDVVHLSNALLLGLAGPVRRSIGCKIVCSLQDENEWIDPMEAGYRQQIWDLMARRAEDVDRFIAASLYYARFAQGRLGLSHHQVHVVHPGVPLEGYQVSPLPQDPPVLGYLNRAAESLGLGILVDALLILRRSPEFGELTLQVMGGHTADDEAFLRRIRDTLEQEGCADAVQIHPTFDRQDRIGFLKSLTLLSVPVPTGEAFGTYLVEALASGVPVVQPDVGGFPEFVAATGGGILYSPNDAETLAGNIASLLRDPHRLRALAERGRSAVLDQFSIDTMVSGMTDIYEHLVAGTPGATA